MKAKLPVRQCRTLHECDLCKDHIKADEWYFDGGHGNRMHPKCLLDETGNNWSEIVEPLLENIPCYESRENKGHIEARQAIVEIVMEAMKKTGLEIWRPES
jgi:hypothetical protein